MVLRRLALSEAPPPTAPPPPPMTLLSVPCLPVFAGKAERIWSLLEAGGIVYVCGDAGKMAPAVRAALAGLIARKSGLEPAAADRRLDAMAAQGRYLVDVWASG